VEDRGLQPIEATLFSREHLQSTRVIHHDPTNFALAVRTLWWARKSALSVDGEPLEVGTSRPVSIPTSHRYEPSSQHCQVPCTYLASVAARLAKKRCDPPSLRDVLLDLAWENRDIPTRHLDFFAGVQVVSAEAWERATEWDNVLGYHDADCRVIRLHERLLSNATRLRENLLIALGESLLGRYLQHRRWIADEHPASFAGRCYEIRLRPPDQRECFLSDDQLRTYLTLSRMTADPDDPLIHRISINNDEGFLPSGLLFGLLYAWYLDNAYGGVMEYEMSLLRWPPESLMPQHAKELVRKQALVRFFREEIFGHPREA
jgi:hypothetical protein